MANRSYLYATDTLPGQRSTGARAERIGLSEWPYVIPLTHAILVSANTAQCPSTIWDGKQAFVGDYAGGLACLKHFLDQVTASAAQLLIREAIAFLERDANRRRYILLELQEIFAMDDNSEEQAVIFIARLASLDNDIDAELTSLLPATATASPGFLAGLFRQTNPASTPVDADVVETIREWGLGEWSNHLYY